MYPLLNTAIKAARGAGNIMMNATKRLDQISISTKSVRDFVTEIDIASERYIIEILSTAYPDHAILGEESSSQNHDKYQLLQQDNLWIIDPLDGTLNFIHGFPQFSVSIAFQYKNRLEIGTIYDPVRQDLYVATRGTGARQNEKRIRVAKRSHLTDCLIGTGFPNRKEGNVEQYFDGLKALSLKSCGTRRAGSAALNLAYVASGQLDGFWENGLEPWDMAAGALIIQEAGGLVSDFNGTENFLANNNIVCGNPKIFKILLQAVHQHYHVSP